MARHSEAGAHPGVEAFPYDASQRAGKLNGLDRLRAIADRKLAQHLYVLYAQAERNSVTETRPHASSAVAERAALERLAARSLDGEFGPDARELATYLLLDDVGRQRADPLTLQLFAE